MQQPPQWCRIPHTPKPPSIDVLQADTGLSRTGGTWLAVRRGACLIRCIGTCAGASCPTWLADLVGTRPLWLRSALSSSALCYPPFSRQRRGPTGEVGGSGGHLAAAISRHQESCVYWILEQVYHTPRTLSSILYSVFAGWFSLGCWWGSPRRSRALESGPTITGGRSRSPSDSRRGLVPVAPPAPRPRREGRACAPQSSDIICNPPSALATDGTPRRGSRARSLHGPRHTSPIAAPPLLRPGFGSHTRTICRPGTGCSRTSPGGLQKNKPPGWWSSLGTWCISALRSGASG